MRLYLSSFQIGNYSQELIRLAGYGVKCAIIVNAADLSSESERKEQLDKQHANMKNLNFQPEELDLRNYFGYEDKLREDLNQYGLVWVKGGNAFILKRAIEQTKFDSIIKEKLEKDLIVYAGYSAGVCVIGPTLKGLELVDDPFQVPPNYPDKFSWEGLNLIDFTIVPHYKSDHPESLRIDKFIKYLNKNNLRYKPLHDGEVLVIDGDNEDLLQNSKFL